MFISHSSIGPSDPRSFVAGFIIRAAVTGCERELARAPSDAFVFVEEDDGDFGVAVVRRARLAEVADDLTWLRGRAGVVRDALARADALAAQLDLRDSDVVRGVLLAEDGWICVALVSRALRDVTVNAPGGAA